MKKCCKFFVLSIMCISVLLNVPIYASAILQDEHLDFQSDNDESEINFGLNVDMEDRSEASIAYTTEIDGLAKRYDPRELDYLTPVEVQSGSNCWMYATAAGIEQFVSYKYGSKFDISESYALVASSEDININHYSTGYRNRSVKNGGTQGEAYQYFTNWNAPVYYRDTCDWKSTILETDYPREKLFNNQNRIDNDFLSANSFYNVKGAKYIKKSSENIKKAIEYYGTVTIDMFFWNKGFNEDTSAYYYSSNPTTPNHTVVIVGWDDDYSVDNFKTDRKPSAKGAWLVRNSNWDGDYFWLSYEEGSQFNMHAHMSVITDVQKANRNEHMLSYDYKIISLKEKCTTTKYLCNTFDISEFKNDYDTIDKVMIYLSVDVLDKYKEKEYNMDLDGICDYEIKILPINSNNQIPQNIDDFSSLAYGDFSGEGYVTVDLNNAFDISETSKIAVVLKVTPHNSYSIFKVPASENHPDEESEHSFVGTSNGSTIEWSNELSNGKDIGNLVIRPILNSSTSVEDEVNISPMNIMPTGNDENVSISSVDNLFSIHTKSNRVLREGIDYEKSLTGVVLKNQFLSSLNGSFTELVFEFINNTTKSIYINPKSEILTVNIIGSTIIGDTLTVSCIGSPERDVYDLNYNWQYSINGTNWNNIYGATSSEYTIDENLLGRYLRVVVTPANYGNVISGKTSESTATKVVLLGDINLDGEVTYNDVDLLTQYLAEMCDLNAEQLLAADFNRNGRISVKDVSAMQRFLLELG